MLNGAATILQQLAPTGMVRAAVNLSNPLLIKSRQPIIAGVSPSLAAAIATRLEVPLEIVEYEHPDMICAAADEWFTDGRDPSKKPWDIALIAADPDRASVIDFTPHYCEIRATCMVPESSTISSFEDMDKEGVRVSVKGGGAYDLWLTRNWKKATLVRSPTLDDSYRTYVDDKLEALAGLRPRLLEDLQRGSGDHRLLDGSFMSVTQAVGCLKVVEEDGGGGVGGGVRIDPPGTLSSVTLSRKPAVLVPWWKSCSRNTEFLDGCRFPRD